MNNTFKSLLSKGISSDIAQRITDSGYNLSTLSACSEKELENLGVDKSLKNQIFDSKRPSIPDNITNNLLYKSRRTCCICRDSNRSIIIHHIKELSLIHISEPTRPLYISYAVFCLKKNAVVLSLGI